MMLDNFKEDLVVARHNMLGNVLYVLCWVFTVVFALYTLLMLQVVMFAFSAGAVLTTVFSAAGAVAMFLAKDHFKVEFEYTFTNGSLDFAKVIAGAKRKELGSMTAATFATVMLPNSLRLAPAITFAKSSEPFVNVYSNSTLK